MSNNMNMITWLKRRVEYIVPFFIAFILYFGYVCKSGDMTALSYDAADIWKTITSWYTNDIYGSYVLYKGINSVYPYVWLYQLALIFNINAWILIKMFFALAFSYTSAIGFPDIIKRMTNRQIGLCRRLLTVFFCWIFWYYTGIFTSLMIDLPCLFYYVLSINFALCIYRKNKHLLLYILAGIFCGLSLSASGQYSVASVCIVIFIILVTFRAYRINEKLEKICIRVLGLLLSMIVIIVWNKYFEYAFVNPLRDSGAWIPDSGQWLSAGLTRFIGTYREGGYAISIPSNRNIAIFQNYLGNNFSKLEQIIYNGGYPMTVLEYINLFFRYPFDFILCYLNAFFLILSPDWGGFHFWPLFVFYSFIYIGLYIGIKRCKTWKNLFSPMIWIIFSFLWSIVPLLIMNIEPRTCIQIQGFIIALAICDDAFWRGFKNIIDYLCKRKKQKVSTGWKIPYLQIGWLMFICVCFLHISTLYENADIPASNMLIDFTKDFTQGR